MKDSPPPVIEDLISRIDIEVDQRPLNTTLIYSLVARLNTEVRKHHWWADFVDRCPGWDLLFCMMDRDEIIDFRNRMIFLSARLPQGLFRWAHATGHVMRHPDVRGRRYTDAEEDVADEIATCWALFSPPDRAIVDEVA